jgi:hypothetical protein
MPKCGSEAQHEEIEASRGWGTIFDHVNCAVRLSAVGAERIGGNIHEDWRMGIGMR